MLIFEIWLYKNRKLNVKTIWKEFKIRFVADSLETFFVVSKSYRTTLCTKTELLNHEICVPLSLSSQPANGLKLSLR